MNGELNWTPDDMLEVTLNEPDYLLKVRETLSRIGVASRKEKKLYQSCHLLHKKGKYYVVHFKELFALDGKKSSLTDNDIERRNTIAGLLSDWGLVGMVGEAEPRAPLSQIKVLSFSEKDEWILETKYNIGNFRPKIGINSSKYYKILGKKAKKNIKNEKKTEDFCY